MKLTLNLLLLLLIFSHGRTLKAEDKKSPHHIGEFSREGEYIKDYYIIKEKDTFHLFYNLGDAGFTQDWQELKNEKAFGHATSKDLKNWKHHPRILQVIPDSWEGQVVSAPSVVKFKDKWTEVPFTWPSSELWSGWEVAQEKNRTIFSAFLWKTNGNFIRFWEIDWDGETTVVRY